MTETPPQRAFNETRRPKRGMVVWLNDAAYRRLRPKDPHSRAWVIVQADWLNKNPKLPYTIIAPITSCKDGDVRKSTATNVFVKPPFVDVDSFILCGQIQMVETDDIERAKSKKLPEPLEEEIDCALRTMLDIKTRR